MDNGQPGSAVANETFKPMKMRNLTLWSSVLLAMTFSWTGNSAQDTSSPLNQTNSSTSASPAVATNAATGPPSAPKPPTAPTAIVKPSLPADVALSPASAEVVRMTDANVEPNVVLAYVNSSTGTFNLGSSQIIYLRDLGVKDSVITAMMQRDQALTGGVPSAANLTDTWQSTTPAASAAAPAYAPGYTSAPAAPAAAAPANPPPAGVNNNYYDALSPYGRWVNIDGYGWCWQPTTAVTDPGWRPYGNAGRWIYTDDGWYWQSDYSWGGLAFHYGRWFDDPACGWCWWPDNVWAPSWVTWAYNDAYCGWAPLPPFSCWTAGLGFTYCGSPIGFGFGFGLGFGCYNFVPWGGFCAYNPCLYAVGPGLAAGIYGNCNRVNDFAPGDGNIVRNRGIGVDRVSQLSRSEVRRGTIRDVPGAPGRAQPDLVRNENGRTTVYRPTSAGRSTAGLGRGAASTAAGKNITALRQELPGGARVASASTSYPSARSAAGSSRSAIASSAVAGRGAGAQGLASTKSASYWQNSAAASRPAASPTRSSSAQYAPSFTRSASATSGRSGTASAANFSRSSPTSYWQNNAGSVGANRPSASLSNGRQTQTYAARPTSTTSWSSPQYSAPASRSYYSSPSRSWSSSVASRPVYSPRYSSSFGGSSYHSFSSPSFSSRPSYSTFGRSFGGSGFSAARSSPSFSGGGGGFSHSFGGGGGFSRSSGGGGRGGR